MRWTSLSKVPSKHRLEEEVNVDYLTARKILQAFSLKSLAWEVGWQTLREIFKLNQPHRNMRMRPRKLESTPASWDLLALAKALLVLVYLE